MRDRDPVKPHGEADSGQRRTRLARRAVVDAAAELFVERGYAATTVAAISERAQVPPATVYRLHGSKVAILKAWLDAAIGGDDEPVAVADRPEVSRLDSELDARAVVAGFVGVVARINDRVGSVLQVLTGAAELDPSAARLLHDICRQRATGQRRLTRTLHGLEALRDGLTERQAADIVYAMMSPETYRLLVVDRRWPPQRYEKWLTATLCELLLAREPGGR